MRTSYHAGRENFVQCRQCSERFPRRATVSCPRCGRLNDRSTLMLGFKLIAFALFIATVAWTVWAATKVGTKSPSESVKPMPKEAPAASRPPDVRF